MGIWAKEMLSPSSAFGSVVYGTEVTEKKRVKKEYFLKKGGEGEKCSKLA